MNLEQARINMLQCQLRPYSILDEQILNLFMQIPREKFVPQSYQELSLADTSIPLIHNGSLMPPKEEALILQSLQIKASEKVLVLGSGGSYMTALAAKLAQSVYFIASYPEIVTATQQALQAQNIRNVTLVCDAFNKVYTYAPCDVMIITDSIPYLPEALRTCLSVHGRLFAILGEAPSMSATLITRITEEQWQIDKLFETVRPKLAYFPPTSRFQF